MKKISVLAAVFASLSFFAQENTALSSFLKIEGFIDKIGLGYEMPLGEKILLDVNAGFGGANIIMPDKMEYKLGKDNGLSYSGIFFKGQVRYYLNRENRAKKNRSLLNNAGSFIGIQSKLNLNGNREYIGKALLTDIHFGQQMPLGSQFIFRYHVGLGYANNLDLKYSSLYPTLNIGFAYVIK